MGGRSPRKLCSRGSWGRSERNVVQDSGDIGDALLSEGSHPAQVRTEDQVTGGT